jgi:hypothetical protein
MEIPTVDTSAAIAKCALRPTPWFASLNADELDAELTARIDAARCGPAPVRYEPGDDDDDQVEPAPVPEPSRRQRKRTPSLARALREAKKAGIPVTGATFTADSVSLSFGEAVKSNGNALDEWMARAS